jgi:hypothetical protein
MTRLAPHRCRWCGVLSPLWRHCRDCADLDRYVRDQRAALKIADDGSFGRQWLMRVLHGATPVRPNWLG